MPLMATTTIVSDGKYHPFTGFSEFDVQGAIPVIHPVIDGCISLPTQPGIGYDVPAELIQRYAIT